jgi:hypothetical protein
LYSPFLRFIAFCLAAGKPGSQNLFPARSAVEAMVCIVMAGGRDVNENCCAKVCGGWKSLALDLIFGGGGQIESLGMALKTK